jgi:protein-disulfide isomerase
MSLALAFGAVLAVGACNKAGAGGTAAAGLSDDGYTLGDAKAPVTVIEYGSLSCPHCARWEEEVFPAFKAKYVDTGKVRYTFREVLIHPTLDAPAGMLARCVKPDKYFPTVQAVMRSQPQIFGTAEQPGDVRGTLLNIAKSQGMSEQQFTDCLSSTTNLQAAAARQQKVEDAQIQSTPTFIINGKKYDSGEMPIDKMSEAIDPLLKK